MQLKVARLGKPHGIRGEITAELFTDDPESRFVPGAEFITVPAARGPLTLSRLRWNKAVALLTFEGLTDRNKAEELRGTELFIDSEEEEGGEDEGWYEHELLDLDVLVDGNVVGKVAGLTTMPVQDLLVVKTAAGDEVLVPFVDEIVPEIDLDAGEVILTPPPGLFELNLVAEESDEDGEGASSAEADDAKGAPHAD